MKKLSAQENRINELQNQLVYYKEITETVREPFIILDSELHVITVNQAFYKKFKVRKKDTYGRLIYELGDNQWDAPELRELLENILPRHRVLTNYEVTLDFPDLGRKTMLLNARQVDSKQLILLAIEDVTEQSLLKADTDLSTANLIMQRDRLQALNDAKDEFITLASHQLRTPATIVKQYIGMLNDEYAGKITKDQKKMLDIAYSSNERQLMIIEDLLRVARVDAGKVYLEKSSCDVGREVAAVINEQAILFKGRGQLVVLNQPARRVYAHVDQKLMHMVLENLLDNAGKYSRSGKQITVDVRQNETYAIVSFTDTGVGMRKQDIEKLFKKFSRIENPLSVEVGGSGLGLYWAKKILDLHNGTIGVTSKLNVGSTFTVTTPIAINSAPIKVESSVV